MLRFIHFSDIHVWRWSPVWAELFYPKRWLGPANLFLNRAKKFPPHYRQSAVDEIHRLKPDVAVFTGDFSSFSMHAEFTESARLFQPLRDLLGERLFAIPGNHDCYTTPSVKSKILETALPWVHMDTVSRTDLTETLTILSVNHAVPFLWASNGRVTVETQTRLKKVFEEVTSEGRKVILAGHFPYKSPQQFPEGKDHKLIGDKDFAELVKECKPLMYLHGHQHIRWAFRSKLTPETLCLNSGSVAMKSDNPRNQAGFISWNLDEDFQVKHLSAHTFDGKESWIQTPLPEIDETH